MCFFFLFSKVVCVTLKEVCVCVCVILRGTHTTGPLLGFANAPCFAGAGVSPGTTLKCEYVVANTKIYTKSMNMPRLFTA